MINMDSCHFLNFFFGQKKATTEISKCINSLTNLKGSKKFKVRDTSSGSYKIKDIDGVAENQPSSSNHLSPIKQLKSRFFSNNQNVQPTSNQCSSTRSTENHEQPLAPNDKIEDAKHSSDPRDDGLWAENECGVNSEDKAITVSNISTISVIDNGGQAKGTHSTIMVSNDPQTNPKTSVVYVNPPVSSSVVVICPSNSPPDLENTCDNESSPKSEGKDAEYIENPNAQSPSKSAPKTGRKRQQQQIIYDDSLDKSLEKPIATAIVCDIISESRKLYAERKFSLQDVSLQPNLSHSDSDENEQIQQDENKSSKFVDEFLLEGKNSNGIKVRSICESLRRSSEGNNRVDFACIQDSSLQSKRHLISTSKPTTIVKPLPPKTPPKSSKARYLNYQLNLNSVTKIQDLFKDENFIRKFFDYFDPIDYCTLAQVCKIWRKTLYSNHKYWTGIINVIDCNQLRRECLVDRTSQNTKQESEVTKFSIMQSIDENNNESDWYTNKNAQSPNDWPSPPSPLPVPQQSICSPLSLEKTVQSNSFSGSDDLRKQVNFECREEATIKSDTNNDINVPNEQIYRPPSKSCSIQSQISTSSSGLSLLSESSKFESVKTKLYSSIDKRGFDAICLFGANDEDILDLVNRLPPRVLSRIKVGRLNNSSISNKGLESFMAAMTSINELELSGCNELTNNINLAPLKKLTKLIITDCINIADGFAPKLSHIFGQLTDFTIQAYHITDAFFDYLQSNVDGEKLTMLELPNCKELSNQSLRIIARFFPNLKVLSLSGSSKISDEGIETIAEQSRCLNKLDISWCTRVTDAALECMACDLSESLTELVLDRCIHITDLGLGHIARMTRLSSLEIRWCPQVSDQGLETIITMRSLRNLSIAGCHQITMRSLLCLVRSQLIELELTNCPSVSSDLVVYLRKSLPSCNIIF